MPGNGYFEQPAHFLNSEEMMGGNAGCLKENMPKPDSFVYSGMEDHNLFSDSMPVKLNAQMFKDCQENEPYFL